MDSEDDTFKMRFRHDSSNIQNGVGLVKVKGIAFFVVIRLEVKKRYPLIADRYGEYYRLGPITDMSYITAFSTVQFVLMYWTEHKF